MQPPWNDDLSWRWSILLTFENLNDTRDSPRSPDSLAAFPESRRYFVKGGFGPAPD
jgi:hypothetical protein